MAFVTKQGLMTKQGCVIGPSFGHDVHVAQSCYGRGRGRQVLSWTRGRKAA